VLIAGSSSRGAPNPNTSTARPTDLPKPSSPNATANCRASTKPPPRGIEQREKAARQYFADKRNLLKEQKRTLLTISLTGRVHQGAAKPEFSSTNIAHARCLMLNSRHARLQNGSRFVLRLPPPQTCIVDEQNWFRTGEVFMAKKKWNFREAPRSAGTKPTKGPARAPMAKSRLACKHHNITERKDGRTNRKCSNAKLVEVLAQGPSWRRGRHRSACTTWVNVS